MPIQSYQGKALGGLTYPPPTPLGIRRVKPKTTNKTRLTVSLQVSCPVVHQWLYRPIGDTESESNLVLSHAQKWTEILHLKLQDSNVHKLDKIILRKPKVFASQILRLYLTKEGRVRKIFYCLIWIKEPCVRKFEGLARSKILGISQTKMMQ